MAVLPHRTSGVDQRRVAVLDRAPRPGAQLARGGATVPARPVGRHRPPAPAPGGRVVLRETTRPHCRTRPAAHPILSLVGIAAMACLVVIGLGLIGALSAPAQAPTAPAVDVSTSVRP
jgi:hypothetical protein